MADTVVHDLTLTREPVSTLHTYHRNPRQGDVTAICESLAVNGQYRPLVVNRGTHTGRPAEVLAGNHTLMAARDAGWSDIAVCWVDVDDDHAARIVAADNRTADLGDYDDRLLAELLGGLPDLAGTGYTEDDLERIVRELDGGAGLPGDDAPIPKLADRFLIPPFSVLDARSGWWQDRRRGWLSLGLRSDLGRDYQAKIESQVGRDEKLAYKAASSFQDYYRHKNVAEKRLGRELSNEEFEAEHYRPEDRPAAAGTSVFDPVLCEIVYRWFSPAGGHVLDPWAGGSVRGLLAALLGRRYTGIELRPEQVAANEEQAAAILGDAGTGPRWITGDCLDVLPTLDADADLIFGCPPYFDLESYCDDPRDLSAMTTEGFTTAYRAMLGLAAGRLRADRFAVLVVSSARDRHGILRDLRGLTVDAARDAGLALYNELVLVNMIGSLPFRAARSFTGTRVLGRTHQDVLVFVKGDRKRATLACGDIDPADLDAVLAGADPDDPDD